MLKIRSILLILFVCIVCGKHVFSQHTFTEVTDQELYLSERSIVNGISWTNSVRYKGNRFFGSKEWKTGELTFDGKRYKNIQINYDLLDGEIILYDDIPGKEKYIRLNKTKIDSFQFVDQGLVKHFESIQLKTSESKEICQRIYKGKVSYYVRHKKSVQKEIGTVYMGRLYDSNTHYLVDENGAHSFRKKKKVLELLGNPKELKKYIRSNKLSISPKYPNDVIMLLRFAESLNATN